MWLSMNVNFLSKCCISKRFTTTFYPSYLKSKQKNVKCQNLTCLNILKLSLNKLVHTSSGYEGSLKKPVLRLLTKENCSLCEEAVQILFSAPNSYNERLILKEIDILEEGNEELFDLYRYEIPVFFLEKKFISKNKIDLSKLEQELQKLEDNK